VGNRDLPPASSGRRFAPRRNSSSSPRPITPRHCMASATSAGPILAPRSPGRAQMARTRNLHPDVNSAVSGPSCTINLTPLSPNTFAISLWVDEHPVVRSVRDHGPSRIHVRDSIADSSVHVGIQQPGTRCCPVLDQRCPRSDAVSRSRPTRQCPRLHMQCQVARTISRFARTPSSDSAASRPIATSTERQAQRKRMSHGSPRRQERCSTRCRFTA